MRDLNLWKFIRDRIQQRIPLALLVVLDSEGSSPGRQGFKMAVTENELCGSVGGGMLEYKFVELAREKLRASEQSPLVKKQVHSQSAKQDRSGMICSGELTIFMHYFEEAWLPVVESIIVSLEQRENGTLTITSDSLSFSSKIPDFNYLIEQNPDSEFTYQEKTGYKNYLHIIGSGHCSKALSMVMKDLDFHITIYDDRKDLNTFVENDFAHRKVLLDNYSEMEGKIPSGKNVYVVIMTFGHRTDSIAFRAVVNNDYKYLGVLGSKTKISQMKNEWMEDGISEEKINQVFSPIGIQIKSQTPPEIAISIAAEIIAVKNSGN